MTKQIIFIFALLCTLQAQASVQPVQKDTVRHTIHYEVAELLQPILTFNLICMGYGSMGVVSVVISCMDDLDICPGNFGLFGEFLADEIFGYFQIAVEQPAYQAYCKHIAAFQHGLVVHSGVGKAVFHHLRDGGGDDILLNTHFLYRIIGLESGLFQV